MKLDLRTIPQWKSHLGIPTTYALAKYLNVSQGSLSYFEAEGRLISIQTENGVPCAFAVKKIKQLQNPNRRKLRPNLKVGL